MIRIVDALAGLVARGAAPSPVPLPENVRVRTSRVVTTAGGFLAGMGGPATAVTLGRTILVRPGTSLTARLMHHELAHVAQWERHPVTFPIRYIRAHIRHGYRDNPFEREARAAEAGPAQTRGAT
ncbi:MAG: DUF4157 domain-containing protein [Gemmatimonadetes bacterium]|nr:DUF4157 domain-containing protein [Gemmatimonadota bacterium]